MFFKGRDGGCVVLWYDEGLRGCVGIEMKRGQGKVTKVLGIDLKALIV
jgi:hypothetical protein